ncbi:22558_t:CDS:2 [Gigaspora rosea]|nr:22558_t:CDS:2 [Gigaspora rosea]
MTILGKEFFGTAILKKENELKLFFTKQLGKKELHIIFSCPYIFDFKIMPLEKPVSITTLPPTFNYIYNDGYIKFRFDDIIRLRGNKIMSNELNENQYHNIIATLEDQELPTECYRQEDCLFIEKDKKTCIICTKLHKTLIQIKRRAIKGVQSIKTTYASDELLTQHIKETRKIIYKQKRFIELLKTKIKIEEEPISEELERVINEVAQEV